VEANKIVAAMTSKKLTKAAAEYFDGNGNMPVMEISVIKIKDGENERWPLSIFGLQESSFDADPLDVSKIFKISTESI